MTGNREYGTAAEDFSKVDRQGMFLNGLRPSSKREGSETARLDAEVLLAFCLSVDRLFLYLNFERPLSPSERMHYRESLSGEGQCVNLSR